MYEYLSDTYKFVKNVRRNRVLVFCSYLRSAKQYFFQLYDQCDKC